MRPFLQMLMLLASAWMMQIAWLEAATEKYRLVWTSDPATQITVGFNSLTGANGTHFVYYDVVDHGQDTSSYAFKQVATQYLMFKGMNNSYAYLSGLQPNTAYYFVIGDEDATSQRFWFKTAPNVPTERLSIIAGGDSRTNPDRRRNANRIVAKLRPHAVMFGGDYTSTGSAVQWQDWLDDWQLTIGTDGRMIPIIPARGNHENQSQEMPWILGVPGDTYYAINLGGNLLRIYTLNTEISMTGDQATWLGGDMAQNCDVTWKIAQYHRPVRPHVASKEEGVDQYDAWVPWFDTYKMNLVVECDAHAVKRTWPIRPETGVGSEEGFIRDDHDGTVYIGEGCWGAPLRVPDDGKSWSRDTDRFTQFKWIFIDQHQIESRTVQVKDSATVATIGTVNDNDIFAAPVNLDLWNPSSGEVLTVPPIPLTCSMNYPIDGQFIPIGAPISLEAGAVDDSGAVAQVEFFVDGTSVGVDNTAPYTLNWTAPAAGTYAFHSIATDEAGHTRLSCSISAEASSAFPIVLASLTATVEDETSVVVAWETLQELQHDYFVLERAKLGHEFQAWHQVSGEGTDRNGARYRAVDENPLRGISYYRLRSVDLDGSISYSSVVAVNVRATSPLRVYPNPLPKERRLRVEVEVAEPGQGYLRVYDRRGKLVSTWSSYYQGGTHQRSLSLKGLAAGIYYLEWETEHQRHVKKVVLH